MIDKKQESGIKTMKSFLELWVKFHSIYSDTISKATITGEDEARFLETQETIKKRYETLKGDLEFKYMPHSRLTDPVSAVLTLHGVRFMSEKNLKKLEGDWKDSYIFLNSILEQLKSREYRLGRLDGLGAFLKRIFGKNVQGK